MAEDIVDSGVTVTLKAGKGYEAPWLVFRGSIAQVRSDVIAAFGFAEQAFEQTLAELTVTAGEHLRGTRAVAATMGGVIAPDAAGGPPWDAAKEAEVMAAAPKGDDPWTTAEQQGSTPAQAAPAPEAPSDPLLAEIDKAESLDAIQRLWSREPERFKEEGVQAAVNARRVAAGF